jgi:hypothetical protein
MTATRGHVGSLPREQRSLVDLDDVTLELRTRELVRVALSNASTKPMRPIAANAQKAGRCQGGQMPFDRWTARMRASGA